MAYLCGTSGYVEVGADRLDVTEWSATEQSKWDETTNTGDDGYKTSIVCKKWMTGTLNADFDAVLGPKNAPDVYSGDQVALVLHTDASGAYTITANVQEVSWSQPADGKVSYTITWESNGLFSYA